MWKRAISILIWAISFYLFYNFLTLKLFKNIIEKFPGHVNLPDVNRDIYQLIESRNFKYEKHFAESSDGQILQLIRIVNPIYNKQKQLKPVILHHGFQCTGSLFLISRDGHLDLKTKTYYEYDENNNKIKCDSNKVCNTLGFVLASNQYDVWIANYRSNFYSMNHTKYSVNSYEYWSHSLDDMIRQDIPTMIDYVLKVTNKKTVAWIGHSQGATMIMGLMTLNDKYLNKVKPIITLSPVWSSNNNTFKIVSLAKPFQSLLLKYPSQFPPIPNFSIWIGNLCQNTYLRPLCWQMLKFSMNGEQHTIDMNRMAVYLSHVATGSSTWNLVHFSQMQTYGEQLIPMKHLDFNDQQLNNKKYNQNEAPEYDLKKFNSTHLALIYAANDRICPMSNQKLIKKLLKVKLLLDYQVSDETYDHMDLLYAKTVGDLVNSKVLSLLNSYP